ncbi:hypothetical protein [Sphingopyxis macrogoltabida]|uniref:Uncharacterized protein n=1 Tax=Sphingopyxis macrogoltabida TaxID=33050 RepID=A0AAC9AWB9_SPHMC|nr:hypothetical protein [Sphingopyxis macrogoltabida]ALJ14768.1 hypothetical protein LH19_18010 [Sphingopyxis macrogoltabida]AMU91024.1 hypothetical protein ATM17_18575 [Sphingopyxis macrogoltabida]
MNDPVNPPPAGPAKTGVLHGRFGRTIAFSVIGLAVLSWIAVGAFLLLFEPTLGQRVGAVTAAAVVTEGAFWTCTAVFGISVFQKIKNMLGGRGRS